MIHDIRGKLKKGVIQKVDDSEENSSIHDISVDVLYRQLEGFDGEAKSELFDRLIQELLLDRPLGNILLKEGIDSIVSYNKEHPDDPMPMYSAYMVAFKTMILRLESYIMDSFLEKREDSPDNMDNEDTDSDLD